MIRYLKYKYNLFMGLQERAWLSLALEEMWSSFGAHLLLEHWACHKERDKGLCSISRSSISKVTWH
jgi:hypothetical protein